MHFSRSLFIAFAVTAIIGRSLKSSSPRMIRIVSYPSSSGIMMSMRTTSMFGLFFNGTDGLETLKNNPDIDVVLMDIMMPELDGYDTIRIIRGLEDFRDLPIIAVTAKAMKGDREKCIEAGASDYISKPVNIEQLLSLLRVRLAA